ncbi:MAG: hypothetical protein ACRCXK_09295 [Wohlfahrtiimonas sp.]
MVTILGQMSMNEKNNPPQRTSRVNIRLLPNDLIKLEKMAQRKGIKPTTLAYLIVKEAINKSN